MGDKRILAKVLTEGGSMKVEVTCLGCGLEAALAVEKMLPLCQKCSKAAKSKARGVTRVKPLTPKKAAPKEPKG
jgi:hypothetical protein